MTRRSKRDLEKRVEAIATDTVTFADYCEHHSRCLGSEDEGPTEREFFGRELTSAERAKFWHRIRKVWNGDEQPPRERDDHASLSEETTDK